MHVNSHPLVSVLTPVRNGEKYLRKAVRSILDQTFENFEYLIFDDGSTDRTPEILKEFARQDSRMKVSIKPAGSFIDWLNEGVSAAKGEFIARMDADDISLPHRFACQVEYLQAHPECALVGSRVEFIDPDDSPYKKSDHPLTHAEIDAAHMGKGCGGANLCHPAVMMRREAVLAVGGYKPEHLLAEDLDLFLRLAEGGRQLANMPDILLQYRVHPTCIGATRRAAQLQKIAEVVTEAYVRRGLEPPTDLMEHMPPIQANDHTPEKFMLVADYNGYWRTARKYALRGLLHRPWSPAAWKTAARYSLGWGAGS